MRRHAALAVAGLILAAACRRGEPPPPPPPDLDSSDLARAVLDEGDLGQGWKEEKDPAPNTLQIGGRVGAAVTRPSLAESTSVLRQEESAVESGQKRGFISNTVILLRSEQAARSIIALHNEAADKTSWTQDRDDGSKGAFTYTGAVEEIPPLGDDMFTARVKAAITDPSGTKSESRIEYVVYQLGPLVAFVVGENTKIDIPARRQEAKVARLLTS